MGVSLCAGLPWFSAAFIFFSIGQLKQSLAGFVLRGDIAVQTGDLGAFLFGKETKSVRAPGLVGQLLRVALLSFEWGWTEIR